MREARMSAVFITPPSLAMSSGFFLLFALHPGLIAKRVNQILIIASALTAGYLSMSKSFVFALPIILILSYPTVTTGTRWVFGLLVAIAVTMIPYVLDHGIGLLDLDASLEGITGGRYGSGDRGLAFATSIVLHDSPLGGYGLAHHPWADYADSAMNRYLLGGGVIGLGAIVIGLAAQTRTFFERRATTPWATFGLQILPLSVAFGLTGPLTYMARINDIFFMFVGLSVAAVEHARSAAPRDEPWGATSAEVHQT
jgi:hypothetical protein